MDLWLHLRFDSLFGQMDLFSKLTKILAIFAAFLFVGVAYFVWKTEKVKAGFGEGQVLYLRLCFKFF